MSFILLHFLINDYINLYQSNMVVYVFQPKRLIEILLVERNYHTLQVLEE